MSWDCLFFCDLDIKDQFLGVIAQHFYCMIYFTAVEPLAVDKFPYLCDELAGPFESRFFASYVNEIRLSCTCEGCGNKS